MNTTDQLQQHLNVPAQILPNGYSFKTTANRLACTDGTYLSVQASRNHYCTPRVDIGPYTQVEVGFPSVAPPETWMDYCENVDEPTDTVYGYIPIELVVEFIDAHGGIHEDQDK